MELRQLKTLVNILDHGGFAAAGNSIGLTQSAVSLQIKALEEELGAELFDRSKRPPQANAKAIALARKSREILRMCSDLSDFSEKQLSGSLQLGTVPTIQTTILPTALKELRNSHPELFISISSGLSDELTRSVHRGILDAAIVSEPTKLSTGMTWQPFLSESLVVIAPLDALGENAKEILEKNAYIRFKRTAWAGELINTELKDLGIRVKNSIETDNLDSIWKMVACGMGVSVVPQHLTKQDSRHQSEKVRSLALGEKPVELVTGLVTRSTDPKSHLIAALYDALANNKEDHDSSL